MRKDPNNLSKNYLITMNSNPSLHNKLALVTGASGGIGAAVAARLAREGAATLVHYNSSRDAAQNVAREITEAGGRAQIVGADLGAREGAAHLISQLDGAFDGEFAGRLDVLVNNAGIVDVSVLTDATDEAFDALFDLNVRAVFQLSREAARRMTKSGWGRIINMGSVFGEAAPEPGLSIYCASKFAIQGFTRAWSRDLGSAGITVNNVQPAVIQDNPGPDHPARASMEKFASVGRFGKTAEVADVVAFLARPDSAFINGASINVDGGWLA